ncbi:MAG: CAAX prenyl protease-related protein [Planctomycetota bacterium]
MSNPTVGESDERARPDRVPEAFAYTIPFVVYLVGTVFVSRFEGAAYPVAYGVVAAIVAAVCIGLLRSREILRPHWRIGPGVFLGVLGIVAWIVLSQLHLEGRIAPYLPEFLQPAERASYNPFEDLSNLGMIGFVAVRLFGIAILVPIAEELFWRGFLLRWLIDTEWEKVKLGEYSLQSCAIVTLMFTAAHQEWFAAAAYCLLINGLLYWKKDLWQCIVAHAVSNALLVAYILWSEEWWLW